MQLPPFGLGHCLYRGNLHGHSTHSDGLMSAQAVIKTYADLGYDFTCLSDHLWIDENYAAKSVYDGRKLDRKDFITLPSAELHCYAKNMIKKVCGTSLPTAYQRILPVLMHKSLLQTLLRVRKSLVLLYPWHTRNGIR